VTPKEQIDAKRYVEIWKSTASELDRIKWEDLRSMTEEERRAQADAVMEMGDLWFESCHKVERPIGMVEQQRVFSKWRKAMP